MKRIIAVGILVWATLQMPLTLSLEPKFANATSPNQNSLISTLDASTIAPPESSTFRVTLPLLSAALPAPPSPPLLQSVDCPSNTYRAEYFNNIALQGLPSVVRCEEAINHNWGSSGATPAVRANEFSARWTGYFNFTGGSYTFIGRVDDGIRVWVDGRPIMNHWYDQVPTEYQSRIAILPGIHEVKVEYFENLGDAVTQLIWEQNGLGPRLCQHNWIEGYGRCVELETGAFDLKDFNMSDSLTTVILKDGGRWQVTVMDDVDFELRGCQGTGLTFSSGGSRSEIRLYEEPWNFNDKARCVMVEKF